MARRSSTKTTVIAFAAAAGLHVALLPVVVHLDAESPRRATDPAPTELAEAQPAEGPTSAQLQSTASQVALITDAELAAIMASREAPFDLSGFDQRNPLPSDVDRAGLLAAHAGGELEGGAFRETTRRDHEDQRSEIWNGRDRAQVAIQAPRERRATASSPEAVTRQTATGFDSTTDVGRRARRPEPNPRAGDRRETGEATQAGTTLPDRSWKDDDPVLAPMVATARSAGRTGRLSSDPKVAISDRGSLQADVPRRGRLVGALDAKAASTETNPKPFELAQTASGGAGQGVAGETGPGSATTGKGSGVATSSAKVSKGAASESLRASRSDPYFREFYRRLDRHVVFPRDLAAALEQGTVIARFTLNPDGKVSGIRVAKTSGFRGFDKALVVALRKAGTLGKVPKRLLGSGRSLKITVPYRFSNPLIR